MMLVQGREVQGGLKLCTAISLTGPKWLARITGRKRAWGMSISLTGKRVKYEWQSRALSTEIHCLFLLPV